MLLHRVLWRFGKGEAKGAAFANGALYPETPAVRFHNALGDAQA